MFDERHHNEYPKQIQRQATSSYNQSGARDLLIQCIADYDLLDTNNILMPSTDHQSHHLPQTCYRESLLLFFQFQLFERINFACRVAFCSEYHSICSFLDMIQSCVVVHCPTRCERWMG